MRGSVLHRFPDAVVAANWDSLTLRLRGGRLVTLRLSDPLRGSRGDLEQALAGVQDADQLAGVLGL